MTNILQIHPHEVIGPEKPGRLVAILCDTCNSDRVSALCQGADCVVHEATLEDEQEEMCKLKGHSTPGKSKAVIVDIAKEILRGIMHAVFGSIYVYLFGMRVDLS